jgi:hypothetical protein
MMGNTSPAVLIMAVVAHGAYQPGATNEITRAAEAAYVYLYPLAGTHVIWLSRGGHINELRHRRAYVTAGQSRAAIAPNVDTLYSEAWLDLSNGPILLNVPDTNGRYYSVHLMDGFDQTVGLIGKRTHGTRAGTFLVAGPRSKAAVLPNVGRLDMRTEFVWLLLRIQANGRADYASVNALQDQFSVKPLASRTPDSRPPSFPPVKPGFDTVRQLDAMDGVMFFRVAAEAMKKSPPAPADANIIRQLTRIGISAGKSFDPDALSPETRAALNRGAADGRNKIDAFASDDSNMFAEDIGGGWRRHRVEHFGKDYLRRAATARIARGSLPPEEATYFVARADPEGRKLTGQHRYVLRFERGNLPPVDAFWSVTLYDSEGHFVANPIDRVAVGDRDALVRGKDGSVEIHIQPEPSAGNELNWLPAPRSAPFWLSLRMYLPRKDVVEGRWKAPSVRRIE